MNREYIPKRKGFGRGISPPHLKQERTDLPSIWNHTNFPGCRQEQIYTRLVLDRRLLGQPVWISNEVNTAHPIKNHSGITSPSLISIQSPPIPITRFIKDASSKRNETTFPWFGEKRRGRNIRKQSPTR